MAAKNKILETLQKKAKKKKNLNNGYIFVHFLNPSVHGENSMRSELAIKQKMREYITSHNHIETFSTFFI